MTLTPSIVLGSELSSFGAARKFTFKAGSEPETPMPTPTTSTPFGTDLLKRALARRTASSCFSSMGANLGRLQLDCQSFEHGRNWIGIGQTAIVRAAPFAAGEQQRTSEIFLVEDQRAGIAASAEGAVANRFDFDLVV